MWRLEWLTCGDRTLASAQPNLKTPGDGSAPSVEPSTPFGPCMQRAGSPSRSATVREGDLASFEDIPWPDDVEAAISGPMEGFGREVGTTWRRGTQGAGKRERNESEPTKDGQGREGMV